MSVGFKLGSSMGCTHIPIFDDEAVEDVEYFTIWLFSPFENVKFSMKSANITITPDYDSMCLPKTRK